MNRKNVRRRQIAYAARTCQQKPRTRVRVEMESLEFSALLVSFSPALLYFIYTQEYKFPRKHFNNLNLNLEISL